ncbi:MAG: AAA family ATPase [Paludibacteraceae bacterium]|nr:AAA family ATPase [Paludibacteraceae bacterium]
MKRTTNHPTTTWAAVNATILSTMEFLTSDEQLRCSDEAQQPDPVREAAIAYLQERLNLSRIQVLILTAVLYYSAKHSGRKCDMDDLANLLHMHPLRVLQLRDEFCVLDELGYIVNYQNKDGWSLSMVGEALESLAMDIPFDPQILKLENNFDFLCKANRFIKEGHRYDEDGTIAKNINRLMKQNQHLALVQNLQNIKGEADMWFMLLMMTTLAIEEDSYVNARDLAQMLSERTIRIILKQIMDNKHPFAKQGYIDLRNQAGQVQQGEWVLSQEGWLAMLDNQEEVESIVPIEEDENINMLTSYKQLAQRPLYFSDKTEEQVQTLTNLLHEEQLAKVRQALKTHNMPLGFCCLFYGAPGTGKTELVQQLAIATQRDLFQVNIATLRDKYVGESEKQLKRIFDKYRSLVRTQEHAPILFFNEADAIFGNRMENTQRSVDKMENALQNIILQEMEVLDGIMICTTNLTSCLDKAFDRRFIYKVEFEKPTNQARKLIWQSMLSSLNDEQATELANRFDFSGGQIQNISRKQVINAIFSGKDELDYDQIKLDCQNESISRNSRGKVGF